MYTRYILRLGDVGIAVNKIQAYFNLFQERGIIQTRLVQDGEFGTKTQNVVREYQTVKSLPIDGVIGNATWDSIFATLKSLGITTNIPVASSSYYLTTGNTGIDVFKMQEYLNEIAESNPCLRPVRVDGSYGSAMRIGVQQFQYLYNLQIDGTIGKTTWDSIVNTRNAL